MTVAHVISNLNLKVRKRAVSSGLKLSSRLSPLLYGSGKQLEEETVEALKTKAASYVDLRCLEPKVNGWEYAWKNSFQTFAEIVESAFSPLPAAETKPALIYQAPMFGHIGAWNIKGIADLIGIWPAKDGKVKIRIFEVKSSWKEQTAHRIQVAIYVLLLSKSLGSLTSKVEFEGCVINKESDLEMFEAASLPPFRLEPLIEDVQRLLSQNGELYRIHKTLLSEVPYQLSWRCDNCGFNECCIVRAIETESVALLNLTRGEQKALRQQGISRLEDLAKLKVVPKPDDLRPYNFKEIPALDTQKVQVLSSDPVIGAKLDRLIQRSQFMLYGIRPSSPYTNKIKAMPWLTGTGYGTLPEDSPVLGEDSALSFRPDGMIRVYFHIEWDYMLDIVSMISARVSCTRYKGESVSISKIVARLPEQRVDCLDEERTMLEAFFSELTKAISAIAVDAGSPDEAPIHLYFYTRRERDVLMDAVRRQPSLIAARAVQDLLGS